MNKFTVILIALILITGSVFWATQRDEGEPKKSDAEIKSNQATLVSPREFAELAKNEDVFILDVHTPEQNHIPGTDAFIPDNQIAENAEQLPDDKSTPILVYCRSGNMSASAAEEIAKLGYSKVYNLDGGTNAYKEQQVSVELWPSKKELGTVVYGDIATTTFTLTNYTPLPLKITRISTSCGCTKASVDKKELAAYESTTVSVSFDPAVHKDDTDLGKLTRTIYIETDNSNFSDLESTITATVVKNN
jgi:rhodanese-related sulfurtransferase